MEEKKNYDAKKSEAQWKKYWEENKTYGFDTDSEKEVYSIDTPPPTVSGKMHIGHAFSYSQQDFIARYKRMAGYNVFYPFGTDDNGLPTERLVEKTKKVKARNMPREDFIKLCNEFLKEELPIFIQDWKDIGISCDFSIYYSTINDHSRRIAQWSFLDLYKKGRIYRKDAPSMWCPECKTGVAQVEVQDKQIPSTFNDIVFKLPDGKDLVIATTRPELLPACVSIFYHPEDERYKKYDGLMAKVPLFDFEVPIMADMRVSMDKGTGIVMCCTFGDQTDMEWQKAYNLPIKEAITHTGEMTELAGKYKGLKIKDARKAILGDMKEAGLLLDQKNITHAVNVHERCGVEIEFIKSKQWFVKYLDLKDNLLTWGNEIKWHPEYMKHRYDNWVKGLQWDWLISNQRYFGVAFPVWYCEDCDEVIFADEKDLPVEPIKDKAPLSKCSKCGSSNIIPEKDVLNTWFTSSMTPQIAIQLMDKKIQDKLFPMDLRPQASEIISFWLFNTVVKSRLHFDKTPWKNACISGFVTMHGEKMSKSKGNVIAPQDVMAKYCADAVRFWAASSKLGEDFDYHEKDIVTGQKFIVKMWNASKLAFMHLQDYNLEAPTEFTMIDQWALSKLQTLIKENTKNFDNYEYSKVKSETEKFFYQIVCDNYLEIVKDRLYNPQNYKPEEVLSAKYTLYHLFLGVIKMMAPLIPFITEEVYHQYFAEKEGLKSIHNSEWPKYYDELINKDAEDAGDMAIDIISAVRKYKTENKLSLKTELNQLIINGLDKSDKIASVLKDIKVTTRSKEAVFGETSAIKCENHDIHIDVIN